MRIKISTFIAEHPTPNIQHPTSNTAAIGELIGCWMLDVGCSMLSKNPLQ
jgi:hypothetical protein